MENLKAVYEQMEEFKRKDGRYTLEEAAAFIHEQTGACYEGFKNKLIAAAEKRELATYAPGIPGKYESKITRDFYEQVLWNDMNEWLKKNEPSIDCEFPKPDAPAAMVATLPDTSPSGDVIPGKMPNITIGKLAIKAAWQIECETGKCATADSVIKRLQKWVDTDDYPELLEKIPHGVTWVTKKGKTNSYDIGACEKTLEAWNKS